VSGDPPRSGHRAFAAFYNWASTRAERASRNPYRERLVGDLTGHVLEIGIGNGLNLRYYRHIARLTAIEPDPYMRQHLAGRAETVFFPLEILPATAESLPFEDAAFDAVVTSLVLCSVADQTRALSEIRRVLKPGGEYRFMEHVRAEGLGGAILDAIRPGWSLCAGGCQPNRRTEAAIRAAGFTIESIERYREGILPHILGIASWRAPAEAAPRPGRL
jgi:ubiquinone/menaquinone biosynthesis C-methylase UbiE